LDTQNYPHLNQSARFCCTRFDFDRDPDLILTWLEKRKLVIPDSLELPNIGYVVKSKTEGPIALGFLRQCEGNVGMIDSLISDPEIKPEIRDGAIDFLILRLIAAAKRKKIYKVFGFSEDGNTLLRAKKHGFKLLSQRLVAITLS